MESALRVGDLVVPSRVSPTFRKTHGFGVIIGILTHTSTQGSNVTTYKVKFVKSLRAFRFGFDGVRRYE